MRIVMNGVTGRMGYRQHLVRSILAIRDDGGVLRPDGTRLQVEPVIVGRNREKITEIARKHDIDTVHTDLDAALAEDDAPVYFDSLVTSERKKTILRAIATGKHVYTEKPIAESVAEGQELADAARAAGIVNGVVHDKIYLPGLIKLKRLVDGGFSKRIMFGSDQTAWPQAIGLAIRTIEQAPFLTATQKRDILYNNAARFLRLTKEQIARDHAR